jgi:hypothetical protein
VFLPETAPKLIALPLTVPVTVALLRQGVPLTTMLPVKSLPFCVQVSTNVPLTWSGVTSCHVPFQVPASVGADDAGADGEAEGTGEGVAAEVAAGCDAAIAGLWDAVAAG